MRIASFNINGVKARLPALLDWLSEAEPDVAVLQEIKSSAADFPAEALEERGYNLAVHGQKGRNGVAILSKLALEDVVRGLPGEAAGEGEEAQARWIEATVVGDRAVRVCGLYLPNGNPAPGPKYDYKLDWMARLDERAGELIAAEAPAVMAGDFNVIPEPRDAAAPEAWGTDALYLPETRAAWRRIVHRGFTDAFRVRHPGAGHYTFWDYQGGAWRRDNGIRIDHALLTPQAADLLTGAHIDRHVRAGEKPSDHVPLVVTLDA